MSGAATPSSPSSAARFAALGTTAGVLDIALDYDATRRGCDLVWQTGDFALDTTAITGCLVALGSDRRAHPTDTLPDDGAAWAHGATAPLADLRRGWAGDALDAQGRRTGSRLWLLARAKMGEQTRKVAESMCAEALTPVQAASGVPMQLTVRVMSPIMLGVRVVTGGAAVTLPVPVGT